MADGAQSQSYIRCPLDGHDLPRVNDYIYNSLVGNFYRVSGIEKGVVHFRSYNDKSVSIRWKYPDDRRHWKISEQRQMLRRLDIQQERMRQNLESDKSEKLILTGKDGKACVLKAHAKLVSESFCAMILHCQSSNLKVELGEAALEVFKNYIHCFRLDSILIDSVAFGELIDLSKMYMINNLYESLVNLMIPIMRNLSTSEFVHWWSALGRLEDVDHARLLDSWKNCEKEDQIDNKEIISRSQLQLNPAE